MKILISDQNINEVKEYDKIILFNDRNNYKSKKIYSILNILENEKLIKKNELNRELNLILKILIKKNKEKFKNFNEEVIFFSLVSEKNIFTNDFYFKFYQYLIFSKIIKSFNKKIYFSYILKDDFFLQIFNKKNYFSSIKSFIKNIFSLLKGLRYHLINNFNLKIYSKKSSYYYETLFVDHYQNFDQKKEISKIWNTLIDNFRNLNYLQLAVNCPKKIKKIKSKKLFNIKSYNNLFIFLNTLAKYLIFYFKIINLNENISKNSYEKIVIKFYKYNFLGSNLLKLINDFNLFNSFFDEYSFKRIFFVSENQNWENALIFLSKIYNKDCYLISYVHTPLRYWDIRYDKSVYDYFYYCLPEYICFSSFQCINQYRKINKYISVKPVEALRYYHMDKQIITSNMINSTKVLTNNFIVFGDIMPKSTFNLLKLIDDYALYLNKKISIYIKFHKSNILNTKIFNNLRILKYNEKLINEKDIFIFPNYTTSSLDFNYHNKICLTFLDKNNFNLSPLFLFKNYKLYFFDVESFEKIINNLISVNIVKEKHNLYLSKNFDLWKKIFDETLN